MGGKMGLYGLLGGQVCIRVQSMWQTRGSGDMLSWEILILDLLLGTIWWNLGRFSHKHNLPFIVSLKLSRAPPTRPERNPGRCSACEHLYDNISLTHHYRTKNLETAAIHHEFDSSCAGEWNLMEQAKRPVLSHQWKWLCCYFKVSNFIHHVVCGLYHFVVPSKINWVWIDLASYPGSW